MNWPSRSPSFCLVVLAALLGGCAPAAIPTPPSSTPSVIPPTFTPAPTATFTPEPTSTPTTIPSPTPLPGALVLPLDTLANSIPWLPRDDSASLSVNFVAFNTRQAPFSSASVRQAFAYAIDRAPLLELASRYGVDSATPATTLTPPDTLGRDLYGDVGVLFDPGKARELLIQAGYSDPSAFPTTVFLVSGYGAYPGARFNIATAMVEMWKTYLGVAVEVQVIRDFRQYTDRLESNPPELFWFGWAADYNDPDDFLRELFHSDSQPVGGFSNPGFDDLVDRAMKATSPAQRQQLYVEAERLLCETEVALIPLYHSR